MTRILNTIAASAALAVISPAAAWRPHSPQCREYWAGWSEITHMFVFGDSYTTTSFNISGPQPSYANPLGNPPYPGYVSSNGPNWVDFLTTTYNNTYLQTINLAYGGATVDSNLTTPYLPTVLSLKDQVRTEYLPVYASPSPSFNWDADSTLFAAFFGINDVGIAYANPNASAVLAASIAEYANLIDEIYQTGARNFLFLNVPPVDRSPLTTAQGAAAQEREAGYIAAWNANVTRLASNLSTTYPDATTFVFDTHEIFSQVLDFPCAYEETCAYVNTTDYCFFYENGTAMWDSYNPKCGVAVDEYFWLNSLHPTFRMHNATARAIVKELEAGW